MLTNENWIDLITPRGLQPFDQVLIWQEATAQGLLQARNREALWLGEHEPVITLGRSAKLQNLLLSETQLTSRGTLLRRTDRGGDVTWHGPGQLVAYPILHLSRHREDLHWYLRELEILLIETLNHYNLKARTIAGLTGVWIDDEQGTAKIASIGVHCSRWITKHGFSLNISPDLKAFDSINACGLNCRQTSLGTLLGASAPTFDEVCHKVAQLFSDRFEPVMDDVVG